MSLVARTVAHATTSCRCGNSTNPRIPTEGYSQQLLVRKTGLEVGGVVNLSPSSYSTEANRDSDQ